MPFSLGRSYDDLPSADSDSTDARPMDIADKEPGGEVPAEPRSTRYRVILAISCVVAIGLGLVGLGSKGFTHGSRIPMSTPSDFQAAPAVATQTGSDEQASVSEGATAGPAPLGTPTEESVPPPAAAGGPTNPWSADIPEAACIPADLPQTGRVVEVLDAATIRVLMDGNGRVYSVRYIGVEVPNRSEENAALSRLALARNTELTYRRAVILVRDLSDADSSGTLLRYVMVDDVFVNLALVKEGWVHVVLSPPDTACQPTFLEAQQLAQREALGLWGDGTGATPTP